MSALVLNFPGTAPRHRSLIGKLTMRETRPTLGSVITYLKVIQEYAEAKHRRDLAHEYEAAWRFIVEHTCGVLPRSHPIPVPVFVETPPMNREIPGWKREVLARPMRKVLKHWEVDVWGGRAGYSYKMRRLKLSCGHLLDEFPVSFAAITPHRRRCRECANEAARNRVIPISRKVGNR